MIHIYPIGSMYGIFTYIWLIFLVNVGKYTIHGLFGYIYICTHLLTLKIYMCISFRSFRYIQNYVIRLIDGKILHSQIEILSPKKLNDWNLAPAHRAWEDNIEKGVTGYVSQRIVPYARAGAGFLPITVCMNNESDVHGLILLTEEFLHQLICRISHYILRWCRISSIDST